MSGILLLAYLRQCSGPDHGPAGALQPPASENAALLLPFASLSSFVEVQHLIYVAQ